MNFYARQESARRQTAVLLVLFGLAAAVVAVFVSLAELAFLRLFGLSSQGVLTWLGTPHAQLTVLVVLGWILAMSWLRATELSQNLEPLMTQLRATKLSARPESLKHKQFKNVCNEISLASGLPCPELYVLESEHSINAFVAGADRFHLALCVTQGALDQLTRHELQAVVAHEFGHLLGGDTVLNTRMVGLLHGIELLGKTGSHYLDFMPANNKLVLVPVAFFGFSLKVIGSVGAFCSQLIKAGVCRHKERLADAESVRLCRSSAGLASALYKIFLSSQQGELDARHAADVSHFSFVPAKQGLLLRLLSSHPSLAERIQNLDPGFLAQKQLSHAMKQQIERMHVTEHSPLTRFLSPQTQGLPSAHSTADQPVTASTLKSLVGDPGAENLAASAELTQRLYELEPELVQPTAESAADFVLGLLKASCKDSNGHELKLTTKHGQLPAELVWSSLEYALQVLAAQPKAVKQKFAEQALEQVKADNHISLLECAQLYLIQRRLGLKLKTTHKVHSYKQASLELNTVFTALILQDFDVHEHLKPNALAKLNSVLAHFGVSQRQSASAPTAAELLSALRTLERLSPLLKQGVMDCSIDTVVNSGSATVFQYLLLQTYAEALGCPLPSLVVE